jgi:hypothetical protein
MAKIRWRLAVGLVSLGVTVILTVPAAASPLNGRIAEIWPNALGPVADIIWPNAPDLSITWPNAIFVGGATGGTQGP